MQKLKELFNQLESAEAETIRLDSLVEENPEDEALEEAWDTEYKKEYDIKMLLANYIVTFTSGKIDLKPYNKKGKTPCEYCEYKTICGFNPRQNGNKYNYIDKKTKDDIILKMKKLKEEEWFYQMKT